jgi:hypothetical protein
MFSKRAIKTVAEAKHSVIDEIGNFRKAMRRLTLRQGGAPS